VNIQEVNSAIMFGVWTNTELDSMIDAVKWNRAALAKTVKRSLQLGATVRFNSRKTGGYVKGVLKEVKIKYATVDTGQGRWRVPLNMLEEA